MPPILYAVPVFMALLLIEVLASRWMGRDVYRVHDAVTSVNIGFISEAVRSLVKLVTVIFYALFVERVGTFQFDIKQPWVWVLAFFMYDFLYYWAHRAGHEVRLLWAAHVVHHSSEDFNLSTALRQSSTNQLFYWVFYLPMAVVGIPASVFVTVALLSAIYQFWVHTQLVPKLGWVDRIFVTPSNHRCHHGRNDYCIDVNYGATLIIWDRIFGTYAQERDNEPVVYGLLKPLRSWNPVWANLTNYAGIWRGLRSTPGWKNKLMEVFATPAWTPDGVTKAAPIDISRLERFETPTPKWQQIYALTACATGFVLFMHWLSVTNSLSVPMRAGYGALIALNAYCLSRMFAGRRYGVQVEALRALLMFGALASGQWFCAVPAAAQIAAAIMGFASLALLAKALGEPVEPLRQMGPA